MLEMAPHAKNCHTVRRKDYTSNFYHNIDKKLKGFLSMLQPILEKEVWNEQ